MNHNLDSICEYAYVTRCEHSLHQSASHVPTTDEANRKATAGVGLGGTSLLHTSRAHRDGLRLRCSLPKRNPVLLGRSFRWK